MTYTFYFIVIFIGVIIAIILLYLCFFGSDIVSVDDAAAALAMSRRTLQRTLAAENLSHQHIKSEVRFRLAGWYLLESAIPIAEIGFICGYSDQAHLTREFNRRVGVPPARYRDLFYST